MIKRNQPANLARHVHPDAYCRLGEVFRRIVFDESISLTGRDDLLTEQGSDDWPNIFRVARFYPAVEYIQANRARTLAMRRMAKLFEEVDIIVAPSFSDAQLTLTNLTGHPSVIVPNGLRGKDAPKPPLVDSGDDDSIGGPGTPVSLTFLGGLYSDAALLAFASAYQRATGFHNLQPPRFARGCACSRT